MFKYILGVPAHPLFVHFAVVLLVLLVTGAAVYALVPPLRRRIWWAVAGLALVGPLCAWFATQSGQELYNMLVAQNYPKEIMDQVDKHLNYGNTTFNYSIGLGAATLVLVVLSSFIRARAPQGQQRLTMFATVGMSLVVLVLAGITGYYVFKTGDAGSHAVWGSFTKS